MIKTIAIPDAPNREGNDFDKAVKESLETVLPLKLPIYTAQHLQGLVASQYTGVIVRCSNGNSGVECLAYCNGKIWRVIELGNRIG